jgi:hypothetical protein
LHNITKLNRYLNLIVSGGQTGVDRAALDVAIKLRIHHGGWCPHNRIAEDGLIPITYNLKEVPATSSMNPADYDCYKQRTELNAIDSDGTLIILEGNPIGGTSYTIDMLLKHKKPHFIYDLAINFFCEDIAEWIIENKIRKLNVAGPRESQAPGIYKRSFCIMEHALNHLLMVKINFE